MLTLVRPLMTARHDPCLIEFICPFPLNGLGDIMANTKG